MTEILHGSLGAAVGPVGSEVGRSPSTLSPGQSVPAGGLAPGQRWSVGRKREVVLRLLRGEAAEGLSGDLGDHDDWDKTSRVCCRLGIRGWNRRCVWLGWGLMVNPGLEFAVHRHTEKIAATSVV